MSCNRWVDKLVYSYNEIVISDKKERSVDSLNNVNELGFLVVKYTKHKHR